MKTIPTLGVLAFAAFACSGCYAVSRGSHILVGAQGPPIAPESVKIYHRPPARYEVVALVSSKGHTDPMFPARDQALMDAAIMRLKREAGQLGANGVLLTGVGEQQTGSTQSVINSSSEVSGAHKNIGFSSTMDTNLTSTTASFDKVVSGKAIRVIRE